MRRDQIRIVRQRSIGPFIIDNRNRKPESLHTHMFLEDVRNFILPYSPRNESYVEFSSKDKSVLEKILVIFSQNPFGNYSLDARDAIEEFIRKSAAYLASSGKVYCEVIQIMLAPTKDQGILEEGELLALDFIPGKVIKFFVWYVQIARTLNSKWPKIIFLPSSQVRTLQLPKVFGHPRDQRLLINTLNNSGQPIPGFLQNSNKNPFEDKEVDFLEFNHNQDILSVAATTRWGWPGRGLYDQKALDYFILLRRLRFAYSLSILRDYLLHEINEFLKISNVDCNVNFVGLQSSEGIRSALESLEAGKISFEEALSIIH